MKNIELYAFKETLIRNVNAFLSEGGNYMAASLVLSGISKEIDALLQAELEKEKNEICNQSIIDSQSQDVNQDFNENASEESYPIEGADSNSLEVEQDTK